MSVRGKIIPLIVAAVSGVSAASLTYLVPKSDAIVVGTQASLVSYTSGGGYSFKLSVERTMKGSIAVGSLINVFFSSPHQVWPSAAQAPRGIWFLQERSDGGWSCLPAASHGNVVLLTQLSLPVSSIPLPAELQYEPSSTSATDQIVFELAAAQPVDPAVMLRATYDVDSQAVTQALRYMSANQSGDLALVGLAGLIQKGDVASVLRTEQITPGINGTSSGGQEVASAISTTFRNADPSAVASLGRMATSAGTPVKLKMASASALAAIHTATAVGYLGTLLGNPSLQLQLYAAQGLSFFANGVGIVTPAGMPSLSHLNVRQPSAYSTSDTMKHIGPAINQEGSFIAYWQAWWQQHPELHLVN